MVMRLTLFRIFPNGMVSPTQNRKVFYNFFDVTVFGVHFNKPHLYYVERKKPGAGTGTGGYGVSPLMETPVCDAGTYVRDHGLAGASRHGGVKSRALFQGRGPSFHLTAKHPKGWEARWASTLSDLSPVVSCHPLLWFAERVYSI